MNQAVIERAQALAAEIAHSPEYISMRAAEEEEIVAAYARYNEAHQRIEDISMQETPDFDQMGALTREMEEIQEEIKNFPLAKAMRQARNAFTAMMQQVNSELSKVLSPGSAGCSGDCSGCGGHCRH